MITDLLYIITFGYLSITFLTILGKIQKNEIKNLDDVKLFLAGKGYVLCKNYNIMKITAKEKYDKCFKPKRLFDDEHSGNILNVKIVKKNNQIYYDIIENIENVIKMTKKCDEGDVLYVKMGDVYKEVSYDKLINKNDVELFNLLLNESFLNDEKMFLNIEVMDKNSDQSYDITHELTKYYVEGNTILSTAFLNYMLFKKFNINLDNYIINIMNKDIEMFTLTKNQSIKIIKNKDEKLIYEIQDVICKK